VAATWLFRWRLDAASKPIRFVDLLHFAVGKFLKLCRQIIRNYSRRVRWLRGGCHGRGLNYSLYRGDIFGLSRDKPPSLSRASRARMSQAHATMGAVVCFLLPHVWRGFVPGPARVASEPDASSPPQTLLRPRPTQQWVSPLQRKNRHQKLTRLCLRPTRRVSAAAPIAGS
jgi:hypothetical protein